LRIDPPRGLSSLGRQSSNSCTVYDIGEFEDRPFVLMELLEGETLRSRIDGPLGLAALFDLAIQIASGLDAVRVSGIVHRDIKPSNIFVTTAGQVKIFDFGLAGASDGLSPNNADISSIAFSTRIVSK
jgi:eukaryotic-like serine/threonine-protein kinase